MPSFNLDPRDGFSSSSNANSTSCSSCCCEQVHVIPGERTKIVLKGGQWANSIRAKLVAPVSITLSQLTANPPAPIATNLPPTNIDYLFRTPVNITYIGTVATSAADPEGAALSYGLLPLSGPLHGTVIMNSLGAFSYTPTLGWNGADAFSYTTSDSVNPPVIHVVNMLTDYALPSAPTPAPSSVALLSVPSSQVALRGNDVEFPLIVSPAAVVGSVWRLTVAVDAMECDGFLYRNISCYDITVVKC